MAGAFDITAGGRGHKTAGSRQVKEDAAALPQPLLLLLFLYKAEKKKTDHLKLNNTYVYTATTIREMIEKSLFFFSKDWPYNKQNGHRRRTHVC